MTNAERQARFMANKAAEGLVQCNVWVPAGRVADLRLAAERMRENPDLTVARLVNETTGRLTGLRKRAPRNG